MYLYNQEKEAINDEQFKYLASGTTANVLYNDQIILKKYHSSTSNYRRIKKEVFDILKDINNPNFIKLYDIYYNLQDFPLTTKKAISAYTAKYYIKSNIDPLRIKKDYIIENFRELEKLFKILANERIYIVDAIYCNLIYQDNNIVIIDPDMYLLDTKKTEEEIINHNLKELANLFGSICNSHVPGNTTLKPVNQICLFDDEEMKDIPLAIERKLKPYQRINEVIKY